MRKKIESRFRKIASAMFAVAMAVALVPKIGLGTVRADDSDSDVSAEDVQITIDATNFPDKNFRNYIEYKYDVANPKGVFTQDEIDNAKEFYCSNRGIRSFKGIEYFTAAELLYCSNNRNLAELDVSKNINLVTLDCSACSSLSKLVLSEETTLETLYCNSCALTELDVGKAPNLKDLNCSYNSSLSNLTVNGAANLESLICNSTDITKLDLSKNRKLLSVECNNSSLTEVTLGQHPDLKEFKCYYNNIVSLDFSGCPSLEILYCYKNNLSRLRISNNPKLSLLECDSNPMTDINISFCPYLIETYQKDDPDLNSWRDNDGKKLQFWHYQYSVELEDGSTVFCTIEVDDDDMFIIEAPVYKVTVATDGNGTAAPSVASGTEWTEVALSATPNPGYQFKGWEVVSGYVKVVDNKFQIADADVEIKAIFELATRTVTVTSDGNGTASASVTSGVMGTQVTLSAVPNPGYILENWQVISGDVTVTNNAFAIGTSNVEIKAVFRPVNFGDFVERLYTVALGRASEAEGKAFWVEQVEKKGMTGADCARFFLLDAPEFLGRGLTDEEFVEILYMTFFDRASEAEGKAYWLERLASGSSKADVVNDFIESVEWCNICATYGVKSGAKWHKATIASKNAIKFATRLYTCCLGRDPEADGLEYWSLALTNLDVSGYQAASLFFESPEFLGFNTSNEEYIRRLYTTFMGREADTDGFNFWLELLNNGTSRTDAMKVFAACPEFQEICNQYAIDRGEI